MLPRRSLNRHQTSPTLTAADSDTGPEGQAPFLGSVSVIRSLDCFTLSASTASFLEVSTELALGRLTSVKPREVWRHEALDFTPWLLKNADVLSDLLGMDLVLEAAEHPVGGFSLDLIGRDETNGTVVIVENQLEESDHTHLGQILTYAAGTNPTTIVWVNTGFRPEHRAAIDWLNERTSEDTRFFGVEIEVVRIGDSDPAPAFRLVAQPNDWEKQVKAAATSGAVTAREAAYSEFWTNFLARVRAEYPTWTRGTTSKSSWVGMSAGTPHANWIFAFTSGGIAVILEFVHPDPDINIARLERLQGHRDAIEAAYGAPLSWEPKQGFKVTKVCAYGPAVDVANRDAWTSTIAWFLDTGARFRAAVEGAGGPPAV